MAEIKLTKANFEQEVLQSDLPVLVDFWASWCGPCMMMGPEIAALAEEKEGVLKVGKINVDEEPELAQKFRIASIPTLMLFKNGQVVNSVIGFRPKNELEELLK